MIEVENIDVFGFEHAIRGMRNPMNSWDKSDSVKCYANRDCPGICKSNTCGLCIGKNDLALMRRLYAAGPEHRKYLRQIFVSMDITAPLYWWKEFDTYKVGVVANSCSTMHKLTAKEFVLDDFSLEHLLSTGCDLITVDKSSGKFVYSTSIQPLRLMLEYILPSLNILREKYLETGDKKYWWQIIQLLPSSYNQRRTVTMDYENVMTIIKQRTGHKLDEWNDFVDILKDSLPYVKAIRGESI